MTNQSQPAGAARPGPILAVLCLAAFMASLDLFIVNVAFSAIGRSFHGVALSDLSWILNGYAIVYAALLVPLGRLADRFSRRGGFLLGLAVFTAASAACAASSGLWMLVAFRVVQAAGAALLTPTSLGLVVAAFAPEKRTKAVRIWAASGALASAFGPVAGGLLLSLSWRWVFLVNVPIGVGALVAAALLVPRSDHREVGPWPDLPGALLLMVGIGSLSLGLVKGPDWGWGSIDALIAFGVAILSVASFVWRSGRHHSPVVDPALLKVKSFAAANVTALAFSVSFAAVLLSNILWLQQVWHYSALRTGLGVAPGPLMVPIFAAVAQRLSRRFNPGQIIAAGCLACATGSLVILTSVGQNPHYVSEFMPGWLIGGVGVGLALPTLLSSATADLPAARAATGSAVINMSRQVGTALGVSVLIAILGSPVGYPAAHRAFVHGWWTLTIISLAAAALALATSRPRRPAPGDAVPLSAAVTAGR
jgi:EmrB/QacA subfamily drug resistance transporter